MAGPIRPRHSGASLIRSGGAGLQVLALEPADEVLNPEPMALLTDQPSDGRRGVGHLEGTSEGAREGRKLGWQQGPDALLQVGDSGWIEG